jgi:hypothetical protein
VRRSRIRGRRTEAARAGTAARERFWQQLGALPTLQRKLQ